MVPAIQLEMISVSLIVEIGIYEVLLERELNSDRLQVTWRDATGASASVLAPKENRHIPIWGEHIYNLSDLLFFLMGIEPIKVQKSKIQEDSPLVRLSFRDLIWYCYLAQDHLDSSFYHLHDPARMHKSRDVMRFLVGFYSEKLNKLQIDLERTRETKNAKLLTAKELKSFLKKFGYDSVEEIQNEIASTTNLLGQARKERERISAGYSKETHVGDDLRKALREAGDTLFAEETRQGDLQDRIEEQLSLVAELISSKFKLARSNAFSKVLSDVDFSSCPSCGNSLQKSRKKSKEQCLLCLSESASSEIEIGVQAESIRMELDSRIIELENSIEIHKIALTNQQKLVKALIIRKGELEERLQRELRNYDTKYLARYREIEGQIATYLERIKGQTKLKQMPDEIMALEAAADSLAGEEQKLKREIEEEKSKLTKAEDYIVELEGVFLDTMLAIGLPGVEVESRVQINRKSWEVDVYPYGDSLLKWNFYNAGSGGKKTLFNVCYAIAVHVVAARNHFPLPSFLMIDTPMKNIGEEVNRNIFESFYNHLYELAAGELRETRFVIIDKEYIAPSSSLDVYERYMTPDNDEYPPLISYYRGS